MKTGEEQERDNDLVLSFDAIRSAVGLVAFMLPAILLIIGAATGQDKPSISDHYHGAGRDFLVGSLCAIAVFMLAYRGYAPRPGENRVLTDRTVSLGIGASALLVAFIPTVQDGMPNPTFLSALLGKVTPFPVEILHFAGAGMLFLLMAWMCLVNFRRASPAMTPEQFRFKSRKNRFYAGCGIAILVFTALAGLKLAVPSLLADTFPGLLFWLEAMAVWSFALAWFVKGDAMGLIN